MPCNCLVDSLESPAQSLLHRTSKRHRSPANWPPPSPEADSEPSPPVVTGAFVPPPNLHSAEPNKKKVARIFRGFLDLKKLYDFYDVFSWSQI